MERIVEAVFIAPEEGAAVVALDRVEAVAGRGLAGDRYYRPEDGGRPTDEITLIEAEGLEAARDEDGLDLAPGTHRRNIVTRGVDLTSLLGTRVRVGEAEVEILRRNPPCRHLEELTGAPVVEGLRDRGGVRGRIVTGGVIRVGDPIVPVADRPAADRPA